LNKISLAIAAVALLASSSTFAAGDVKIGLVKLDKVFKEAAPAVRAQKKLEKEFAARDQELQKLGSRRAISSHCWRRKRDHERFRPSRQGAEAGAADP